jgi:hypothetical protein
MLIVESATAILDLIIGVSEIYVLSVEILAADCQMVDLRHLAVEFLDLKFPKWYCSRLF